MEDVPRTMRVQVADWTVWRQTDEKRERPVEVPSQTSTTGGLRDRLVLQPLSWALGMDEWSAEENRAPRHALCLRFHFNITVVLRLIDEGRRYSLLHRAVHSELFCLFFFSTSRFVVANSWPTWHDVHHSLVLSVSAVYSLTLTTYAVAAWGVYFVPLHTALWFKKKNKTRRNDALCTRI